MTREELLRSLREERERWDSLVAEVGPNRLEQPGACGPWSVRDVIAHIAAWEGRAAVWLEAAAAATKPAPGRWPSGLSEAATNEWIFQAQRATPLPQILHESEHVHNHLVALVEAFPESELDCTYDWLGGSSLEDAIPGNSSEHYREHAGGIRAWLAQQPVGAARS